MNDTLTGQTVLVTGGAGFIGSHLVDAVVGENEVRVLDDLSSGTRTNLHPAATLVEGDLRDPEVLARAMRNVDVVFHEAAVVSVRASVEDPTTSHAINCTATLDLLERAREEDARVVLASSAAVYGHPTGVPIDEGQPMTPTSPYGVQKLAIDQYARQYHELYGLDTVPLRYFNAYGPRQTGGDYSGVISVFMRQAQHGDPITIEGDGTQTRDFVHVDDIVQANLLAATTDHVGEAYNIGTADAVTIRRLAEHVRDIADSDSEIVHVESRPGDIRHSVADIDAARDRLGFEPSVSLADGLAELRTWAADREN